MASQLGVNQKRLIAVALLVGGGLTARQLQALVRSAQREQASICASIAGAQPEREKARRPPKIAVDDLFFKRLHVILRICVPKAVSRESGLILLQGVLLVCRTLLTEHISRLEGRCGSSLVAQDFNTFARSIFGFAAVGLPAAVVNSGLKYMQKQIQLAFMERLTLHLHRNYCSNRAYYAASVLGGLTNADQRITEDVEKFSFAISELYNYTFKPLIDVVVHTRSLSRVMGYQGQLVLYLYYAGVAWLLRTLSPPLALMTAQETALTGSLRAAHQRLVAHSEEVAFNDPPGGGAEQMILNLHLQRLLRYTGLSSLQRCLQQVADGYFVKYFATVVAISMYAVPIWLMPPEKRASQQALTQDYIRSMRLLQNTSRAVGDLILVYKRITSLAGHTSRVSELLEAVSRLSRGESEHRELFRRNLSTTRLDAASADAFTAAEEDEAVPARRLQGASIAFRNVALDAPDGSPLVRQLTFAVERGCSVMLMGPNGCGKSSLFRVLAGLWPLKSGEITCPEQRELFYLAQRPYLVAGTLRDQLLYPQPPLHVWESAQPAERAAFMRTSGSACTRPVGVVDDAELARVLEEVELSYLLARGGGWDTTQNWTETLSGGEKQRLAMARLLYQRPTFAVLDECTSAVSADGELKLYQALRRAGITLFSIAHRPALKHFHRIVLHIDGTVHATGKGWWLEHVMHDDEAFIYRGGDA